MNQKMGALINEMICYEKGCARRVNHFLKVHSFAKAIGELEGLDAKTQIILEVAALVHDVGIKPSLLKYNSSAGSYQEREGPAVAERILGKLSYPRDIVDRVSYLVGHHHSYTEIDGMDYQILIEADFLVNIFEDDMSGENIQSIKEKYFKTKSGIAFLENLYLQD